MKGPSPDKVSPSSAIVTMFTSIDAPVCDDDGMVYDGDNHTDDDDDDDVIRPALVSSSGMMPAPLSPLTDKTRSKKQENISEKS